MTFEFYSEVFEKPSNIKYHENPSITNQVVPCGRTDGREDRHDKANIYIYIYINK